MVNGIEKYIEFLKIDMQNEGISQAKSFYPEENLMCLYAYYHYFNADNSKFVDIIDGKVYAPHENDRICAIFVDEESDDLDLDVLLVEYTDSKLNYPGIINYYRAAEEYIYTYFTQKVKVRNSVLNLLSRDDTKLSQDRKVKIKIVTNYFPKADEKRKITKAVATAKPIHINVTYEIVFGNEVEHEILEVENPKEYVDSGYLQLDDLNNYVSFGHEKSVILNISAKSLKALYEENYFRGLFAQNLRYYVKNIKIDSKVVETMQDTPEMFWYYNNGIIIICDDFELRGQSLYLEKFSIVNGGQTTKLVGETDFAKDFFIQCKVIRSKHLKDNDKLEFIAGIAEASNTQKPIKAKDLIANRPEQRRLKKQLADAGVYIQIKRGEKVNKKLYPQPWQNTTNEELGQFLLAFAYQKPGVARANKASVCGNDERYNLLFGKTYDNELIKDLMRIKAVYKKWMTKYVVPEAVDEYKEGLIKNGMYFTVATIGLLAKMYYHKEYFDKLEKALTFEQKIELLSQYDICHGIFDKDDNLEQNLFELFEYCYSTFYRAAYSKMLFLEPTKSRSYSNFTKTDKNYMVYLIDTMLSRFMNGIPESDLEVLDSVFYQASQEDLDSDKDVLKKYVNLVAKDTGDASIVNKEIKACIEEALFNYRTRKYRSLKIKAFEVFNNIAKDRIASNAPQTLTDLQELGVLSEKQLVAYGEDIVKIVKKFTSSIVE